MSSRLALYSAVALLCGCASSRIPESAPAAPQPPVLGVARVQVRSDVVIIPDEVQHVLYPSSGAFSLSATSRPPATAVADDVAPVAAINDASTLFVPEDTMKEELLQVAALARSAPTAQPATAALPSRSDAEVTSAWRKYCKVDRAISLDDWTIIDSTSIPPELAQHWSSECVPAK